MEKKCENCKKYYNCAELVYYNDLTMGLCEDYYIDKEAVMREDLIKLMKKWGDDNNDSLPFESIARFLINNGVYCPPYEKGDNYVSNGYR